jgi:hypothetical protein
MRRLVGKQKQKSSNDDVKLIDPMNGNKRCECNMSKYRDKNSVYRFKEIHIRFCQYSLLKVLQHGLLNMFSQAKMNSSLCFRGSNVFTNRLDIFVDIAMANSFSYSSILWAIMAQLLDYSMLGKRKPLNLNVTFL